MKPNPPTNFGNRRHVQLMLALLVLVACVTKTGQAEGALEVAAPLSTITYTPSLEDFPNPERGFAFQNDVAWPDKTPWGFCGEAQNFTRYDYTAWNTPLQLEFLLQERRQGRSMIQSRYHIADFRGRNLSAQYLAFLQRDFDTARQAGVKIAPRFAYNYPMGGPDAALPVVLAHIGQLQPLLTKNADVIAYLEAGFVGCWGEWHHSSNGLNAEGTPLEGHITPATRQILDALLNAVPPERMIALRYPKQKFEYFGSNDWQPIAPLLVSQAWNGSNRSRIGHQDDCFVCSDTHGGSYTNPRGDVNEVPGFLVTENLFVVQEGEPGDPESINPNEPANPRSPLASCERILQELNDKHWSVVGLFNIGSKYSVIERWKKDGCHDEIARRLGYRYRLLKAQLPQVLARGGTLQANFTLVNDGFANLFNPRMLELILRSQRDGHATRIKVFDDARAKLPFPGVSKDLAFNLKLPAGLKPGRYDLLLALPDPKPKLYHRPEYAIRLANENLWEASTGFNRLGWTLEVR
jgi:hypothetical protein